MTDPQSSATTPSTSPASSALASIRPVRDLQSKRNIPHLKDPSQLVTLYAGQSAKKFVVHKEFARHYSPVLDAAFKSNFIEGQTQEYRLEDTSGGAIQMLIHWFYTQTINTTDAAELFDYSAAQFKDFLRDEGLTLATLWVLAKKHLIHCLQNMTIDELELHRYTQNLLSTKSFSSVYQKTSKDSPLRRLLVDPCAGHLQKRGYKDIPERFPQEMLIDLVTVLRGGIEDILYDELKPGYDMTCYYASEN